MPSQAYPLPPVYASRDCVSCVRHAALGVLLQLFTCCDLELFFRTTLFQDVPTPNPVDTTFSFFFSVCHAK